jgi:hypothetical protein
MNAPVNVLTVMDRAAVNNDAWASLADGETRKARENNSHDIREARAAVAELVEAVKTDLFFTDPGHEKKELRAALARVGGES